MSAIWIVTENRKARFDYEITQTFEAGLVLVGSEVKSMRDKQMQLKDSYVSFRGSEAYLQNAHIAVYKSSSYNNHEPERLRKLLLNRSELDKIDAALRERGLQCIPLKVYFKKGIAKIEIGIARGKKRHDKREAIKTRDVNRELRAGRRG
ncbi:MAG: SsrA-binding protein SmpB [Bdellovibrionaceae bacterium]|nr:SsrA-binding protein SmpB [Pseudobdellovibrionaceae bacterium]